MATIESPGKIDFVQIAPMPDIRPFPSITPFTDRDGDTYARALGFITKYINDMVRLINEADEQKIKDIREELQKTRDDIQTAMNELTTATNTVVADMVEYVDAAVESILNASIEVNDSIVEKLLNNVESLTRVKLDSLYMAQGTASDPATAALVANELSLTRAALDAVYVTKATLGAQMFAELSKEPVKSALDASYKHWRNATEFGAIGDGKTPAAEAIQRAMDAGPGTVVVGEGDWFIESELKVPSGVTLRGVGTAATKLIAAPTLPRAMNVVTNASNNREYRTNYDTHVAVTTMRIDGNYDARPAGGDWLGNASGVMFSTVMYGLIEDVVVENAPLHGFAVDASRLPKLADERPSFIPPGPSRYVEINRCVAINPVIDDGFTTHYSGDITITNCHAIRTIPVAQGGGINNGFEVDDGSYDVTVRDCTATGWQNAVQIKGHNTAHPAYDVVVDNVRAKNCGVGVTVSGDGAYADPLAVDTSRNIRINNFTFQDPRDIGAESLLGTAIKVYSYDMVSITGTRIINAPRGCIVVAKAGNVVIDDVMTFNSFTAPEDPEHGLIRFTGEFKGTATVTNIMCKGKVGGSVIRNNATGNVVINVRGVHAEAASGLTKGLVSDSYMSPYRSYEDLVATGFPKVIDIRAGSGAASDVENYGMHTRGKLAPEGTTIGWPGWIYSDTAGNVYVKKSGTGVTGWKKLAEV